MKEEKGKKRRTVQVRERLTVRVGGKEYVVESNTPTSYFYDDLYGEITATQPLALLGYLGHVGVLDSAGAQICYLSVTPSRYGFGGVRIDTSCTWNSDYPPATFRVISNTGKIYFETPMPSGISASRGSTLDITWEATFSVNITRASGWLAGSSVYPSGLIDQLVSVLTNQRGAVRMTATRTVIRGRAGTNYSYVFVDKDVVRDSTSKLVVLEPTPVEETGEVMSVVLYSTTATGELRELLLLSLPTPYSVKKGDMIGYTLVFE